MEATFYCAFSPTAEAFMMAWWFTGSESHRALLVGMNDGLGARIANHSLEVGERNLTLTVQNIQGLQNRGTYTCRVQAGNVTIEASAILEVLCK